MDHTYSPKYTFPKDTYENLKESKHWNYTNESQDRDLEYYQIRIKEISNTFINKDTNAYPYIISEAKYVTENQSFYGRMDYWRFAPTNFELFREQVFYDFNKTLTSAWNKFVKGKFDEVLGDLTLLLPWDKKVTEQNNFDKFEHEAVRVDLTRTCCSVRSVYVYTFKELGYSDNIKELITLQLEESDNYPSVRPLIYNKVLNWALLKYELDGDINYLDEIATHVYSRFPDGYVGNIMEAVAEIYLVAARYAQILLEWEERVDKPWQNI